MSARSRVYVACEECRRKKIKCDGLQALCSNCARKGKTCIFKQRATIRNRAKKSDVEALAREVKQLREKLLDKRKDDHKDLCSPNTGDEDIYDSGHTSDYTESNLVEDLTPSISETVDFNEFEYPLDTMNYLSVDVFSLITRGYHTFASDTMFQEALKPVSRGDFSQLLENFWYYENGHVMIVWKHLFISDLCANFGGRHSSKSLILAMLAMGSVFSDSTHFGALGDDLFKWSKTLLQDELFHPQISSVQTLNLLCIYSHARGEKTEELYFGKSAVDLAIKLGLNQTVSSSPDSTISEDENALKRFVWWGCYQVDMLSRFAVRHAPTMKKAETNTSPPQLSVRKYFRGLQEDIYSYFEFSFAFTFSLELFVIVGDPLTSLFSTAGGLAIKNKQEIVEVALRELRVFKMSFPEWISTDEVLNQDIAPQVCVFRMRYHYFVMLLKGHFISPEAEMLNPREFQSLNSCVSDSLQVVVLLLKYEEMDSMCTLEVFVSEIMFCGLTVFLCALRFFEEDELRGQCLSGIRELMRVLLKIDTRKIHQRRLNLLIAEWNAYNVFKLKEQFFGLHPIQA
ncbi:unnamed protein product [Kuraishia capsulata CBS 1993]|uniref:Zn(2)-C6 fungal-type domain-containing protein n=1 Tax=Kuraishia capsulata CBS 1993 TaxID=1382522 RepID=W6MLW6_9ASCO|nr:uncharacterized protein KUCA_T00003135001 [Kuraishia capsulata CBS 1993]CDK27158.1 unnamed protein product [Kuraishia capsulata CBS 1993]